MMRTVSPGFAWFCSFVRIKFLHLLDDLAELRVRHTRNRPHDNRFIHTAGNHLARARLALRHEPPVAALTEVITEILARP